MSECDFGTQSEIDRFFARGLPPEIALRKYIASVSINSRETVLGGKHIVGSSAPCRHYQDLVIISSFGEMVNKFHYIQKREDIPQIHADAKAAKAALVDLMTLARAANKRLAHAVRTKRAKLEAEKASSAIPVKMKPGGKKVSSDTKVINFYEAASTTTPTVVTKACAAGQAVEAELLQQPLLMSIKSDAEGMDSLRQKAGEVASKFLAANERAEKGRFMKQMSNDNVEAFEKYAQRHSGNISLLN